eukprot:5117035-Amphidinium_carterae.1
MLGLYLPARKHTMNHMSFGANSKRIPKRMDFPRSKYKNDPNKETTKYKSPNQRESPERGPAVILVLTNTQNASVKIGRRLPTNSSCLENHLGEFKQELKSNNYNNGRISRIRIHISNHKPFSML